MNIYDIIMSVCGMFFVLSFIPQLIRIYKRKSAQDFSYITCLMASIPLLIVGICQYCLHLWFSGTTTFITSFMWFSILVMKRWYGKLTETQRKHNLIYHAGHSPN